MTHCTQCAGGTFRTRPSETRHGPPPETDMERIRQSVEHDIKTRRPGQPRLFQRGDIDR